MTGAWQTKEFVDAGLYDDGEAVLRDAVRALLAEKPELRLEAAILRYRTGKISLAKAATLAGAPWERMREILLCRGVPCASARKPKRRPDRRSAPWRKSLRTLANTTVLSNFAAVGCLELLQRIFGQRGHPAREFEPEVADF